MTVRNISQAHAELSALIAEVLKGNEVILAKAGKPVARLVAYQGPSQPRTPGAMAGEIWIAPCHKMETYAALSYMSRRNRNGDFARAIPHPHAARGARLPRLAAVL